MPHITGPVGHRAHLEVLAGGLWETKESRVLRYNSLVPADSQGQRHVYAGMIVAEDSDASYYVPYNASAAYGTGSDTAVGVLREYWNATLGDPIIEPIVFGRLIEKHCYVLGGTLGTISSGIKSDLGHVIEWV